VGKAKALGALHYNLLDLIRSESRVRAFKGSNSYLAKKMEISETTLKGMLHDLEGPRVPEEQAGSWQRKPARRAGLIEIHTAAPKRVKGEWQRRRTIYLVSNVDDDTGARQVATLASKFGKETRYGTGHFCGQLQCTPEQFRRWLSLCERHGWLEVFLTNSGKRIHRKADRIPYVDQLPDRLCRETFDERSGDLLKSESTWVRLREPTLADRVLELVSHEPEGRCVLSDAGLALRLASPKRSITLAIANLKQAGQLFSHLFARGGGRGRILALRPLAPAEVEIATPKTKAQQRKLSAPKLATRKRSRRLQPSAHAPGAVTQWYRHRDLVAAINAVIDELYAKRLDEWLPEMSRWEDGPEPERIIGDSRAFDAALRDARHQVAKAWAEHIDECARRREAAERQAAREEQARLRGREYGPWTGSEWRTLELLQEYVARVTQRIGRAPNNFDVVEARRDLVLIDDAAEDDSGMPPGPAARQSLRQLARERRSRALRRSLGMVVEPWDPAARLATARAADALEQQRAIEAAVFARSQLMSREPNVHPMVMRLLPRHLNPTRLGSVTPEDIAEAIARARRAGSAHADFAVAELAAYLVVERRWGTEEAARLREKLAATG
jgi:hypothetical protein